MGTLYRIRAASVICQRRMADAENGQDWLTRALAGSDTAREELAVRAVKLLRQAVAGGLEDVSRLKRDANLAPLRPRADFRKLMAELADAGKK